MEKVSAMSQSAVLHELLSAVGKCGTPLRAAAEVPLKINFQMRSAPKLNKEDNLSFAPATTTASHSTAARLQLSHASQGVLTIRLISVDSTRNTGGSTPHCELYQKRS